MCEKYISNQKAMSARLEQTTDKTRGELSRGDRDNKIKEVRREEMEGGAQFRPHVIKDKLTGA